MSSPTGPSAADIFSSPQPGNAKRRLFQPAASSKPGSESVLVKQLNAGVGDTVAAGTRSAAQQVSSNTTQTIMAVTSDGRQVRTYSVFSFLEGISKQRCKWAVSRFGLVGTVFGW